MSSAVLPRSTTVQSPLSSTKSSNDFLPTSSSVVAPSAPIGFPVRISGGLPGIGVVQPFHVLIEADGEGFIAKSPISLVYEWGETWQEALQSYIPVLVEHFEWLTEIEQSLSPAVKEELTLLRKYLWLEK